MKCITRVLIVLVLLDEREPVGATADLVRYIAAISRQCKHASDSALTIACAVVRALVPRHRGARRPVPELVVAVALVRELDPGQREPLRRAEARARRASHGGTGSGRSRQGTAAGALCDASDLRPAGRKRRLSGDEGWSRQPGAGRSRASAIPERIAPRERGNGRAEASSLVDDLRLENTCIGGCLVDVGGERRTVPDIGIVVRTTVDGVLEEVHVPAILEVAVVSVTGGVSVCEDVGAGALVVELVDADNHLVEQGDKLNGMTIGAVATVIVLDGIGHVGLVVRRVQVLSVPARREEDLRAQPVGAAVVKEVVTFGPVRIVIVCSAEIWRLSAMGTIVRYACV